MFSTPRLEGHKAQIALPFTKPGSQRPIFVQANAPLLHSLTLEASITHTASCVDLGTLHRAKGPYIKEIIYVTDTVRFLEDQPRETGRTMVAGRVL